MSSLKRKNEKYSQKETIKKPKRQVGDDEKIKNSYNYSKIYELKKASLFHNFSYF